MDWVLDCFFDETFRQLNRCGLKTRQARKDVIDHLNAVISGGCDGHNLSRAEASGMAVSAAIRYHQQHKGANSSVCLMGKYHNVLYIGMKVAWEWGVTDSETIKALLVEIYACEGTFERIFLGALFGNSAPHFIAGWKSDFNDQDENTRAMVFYLQHAADARLSFPVPMENRGAVLQAHQSKTIARIVRFVDVPIESCGCASPMRVALQASAPDLLLILLRFGANPMPQDGGISPIVAVLDKLTESAGSHYLYQLVACLRIMLSCVTTIEMPYRPLLFDHRKTMFVQKYGRLLADKLICPEQVFGVVSLKQLCRCTIRQVLRENYQLPRGIEQLRLPRHLRRYIDLMEK